MTTDAGPPYFYDFDELPSAMKGALFSVQNRMLPSMGPEDPGNGQKWGPPDAGRYWSEETPVGELYEWSIFHATERYHAMIVRHTLNVNRQQIIRQWYGATHEVERIPVTIEIP